MCVCIYNTYNMETCHIFAKKCFMLSVKKFLTTFENIVPINKGEFLVTPSPAKAKSRVFPMKNRTFECVFRQLPFNQIS